MVGREKMFKFFVVVWLDFHQFIIFGDIQTGIYSFSFHSPDQSWGWLCILIAESYQTQNYTHSYIALVVCLFFCSKTNNFIFTLRILLYVQNFRFKFHQLRIQKISQILRAFHQRYWQSLALIMNNYKSLYKII